MNSTEKRNQTILAVLAVIVGIFMMTAAPMIIQVSVDRVVAELLEVAKERPAFSSGIMLFAFLYPIWRGFIFVAGMTLLAISPAIRQGKKWTYPVGQLAAAFPSMGGMFMFLPYISWVGGFPLPMVISWVGLAYFWSAIFLRNVDKWEKWAHFAVMTLSGMLTTHAFTVGVGNLRTLLTRPGKPLYEGLEWYILSWVGPISFICVVLLVVSIPLVAQKKEKGWWIALIAALSILAIDAPTQIIRTATFDYLIGAGLALALSVSLLFPKFKNALIESQAPVEEAIHSEAILPEAVGAQTG